MNTMTLMKPLSLSAALVLMIGTASAEEKNQPSQTPTPTAEQQPVAPGMMGGPWGGPWGGPGMGGPGMGGPGMGGPGMGGPGMGGRGMGGRGMGGPGMMGGQWTEPAESLSSRLTATKQQLAITPAQEPLWNAYVKALTEQNESKGTLRKEMFSTPRDAVEMETMRLAHMETMLGHKKAVLASYKALLDKLDERQKNILGPAQMQPCNQ